MTPTILRNLFSKPATRLYPTSRREPFPDVRGELVNTIETCIFCGICAMKCPSQCLRVDKAGAWEYNPFACVYCGICVETCPTQSLSMKTQHQSPAPTVGLVTLKGEPPKKKGKAAVAAQTAAAPDTGETPPAADAVGAE